MERDITKKLYDWKTSTNRKPLLITGVRQCGKTYVMQDFGNKNFEDVAYFNFEKNEMLSQVFVSDLNTDRIIQELSIIHGKKIIPGATLVIFDEIQACPRAITSLKYFCEEESRLHIMCAGSLLGVAVKRQNMSFPVGKIDRLTMYPMSFSEFLKAQNNSLHQLVELNIKKGEVLPEAYANALESTLKLYYIIGGMPEVVSSWIENKDIQLVERKQDEIILDYQADFAKHAPKKDIPKLSAIWDSIPLQLAKDNSKYMFSHIKESARAKEYEDSVEWLIDAGLIYKLAKVEKIEKPLAACADATSYKLYMSDVGLLRRKAGVAAKTIIQGDKDYIKFKGALTENFVMSELLVRDKKPYYWCSNNTAEVDFVIEDEGRIIPIEAKSEINTKAKSFGVFCKKYNPEIGFKFSMKNVGEHQVENTKTYSIPLYLVWKMDEYLDSENQLDLVKMLDEKINNVVDELKGV